METLFLIDREGLFDLSLGSVNGADVSAERAAAALFGIDRHFFDFLPTVGGGDRAVRADQRTLAAFDAAFFKNLIAARVIV